MHNESCKKMSGGRFELDVACQTFPVFVHLSCHLFHLELKAF